MTSIEYFCLIRFSADFIRRKNPRKSGKTKLVVYEQKECKSCKGYQGRHIFERLHNKKQQKAGSRYILLSKKLSNVLLLLFIPTEALIINYYIRRSV